MAFTREKLVPTHESEALDDKQKLQMKQRARSFNQNSNRSDREKWSTSKGGPVFSKLFWLDRTDPLSFGPKFPEILVEWIALRVFSTDST